MKILITGHKGFIGQNMVKFLSHHELRFFEWGDEYPQLDNLDWVVHLGAITSTTESNVEKVLEQNLDFSIRLYTDCLKHRVNFQYASSASVYGIGKNFKEDAPVNPLSPYAWSKYLLERYINKNPTDSINVQGFRYFNVYGPHEDHKKDQASPYYKFALQAKENGEIKIFENSENYLRDFVPVELVCSVHEKFFDIKESGVWNLGTGRATSFESVARMVAEKFNAKVKYISMPDNLKNQYQEYTCADLTKLNTTLNEKNFC